MDQMVEENETKKETQTTNDEGYADETQDEEASERKSCIMRPKLSELRTQSTYRETTLSIDQLLDETGKVIPYISFDYLDRLLEASENRLILDEFIKELNDLGNRSSENDVTTNNEIVSS